MSCRQVFRARPLSRFLCEFHAMACLAMLEVFHAEIIMTNPSQYTSVAFHFYSWLVCLGPQSSVVALFDHFTCYASRVVSFYEGVYSIHCLFINSWSYFTLNEKGKTIMQIMILGERRRGNQDKDGRKTCTMATASRVVEDRHRFRKDIWAATSWRV